jgi:hypothetical protein
LRDLDGDLSRYSLGEALGPPGGYGAAFNAVREDGMACVVKLIHGFFDPSVHELDRLQVMLEHLSFVQSDHVVPIIDAGVDGTAAGALPWIAMPQIPGARSLREVMTEARFPLGPQLAQRIGIGVAQGLADLHAANMLHRDIKPGNLLLDADGRPLLIDFELAKIQHLTTRTSRVAEPLGTELYMAPEQLRGPVVPETDLWALGLVLAELLTGRHPVRAAARRRTDVRRVIAVDSLLPDGLPGRWPELLDALLRKVPSARPPNALAVVEWLEASDGRRLARRPVRHSPGWRWSVRSSDDMAAAENCDDEGLSVAAIDASGRARCHRTRRAAEAMPAALSFEPSYDPGQLVFGGPDDVVTPGDSDLEREVWAALRSQRDTQTNPVLLPWKTFDAAGFDDALEVLRLGLRHRAVVGSKQVIATVQLRSGAVTSRADALEIAAVLCALRPDGWRLFVDGLQPRCGPNVLLATADLAFTLATRADVWVRASGLARWPMATLPGVSVLARPGRGLWTHGGGNPRTKPERVEVASLAGPVPRDVVELIAEVWPALLRCGCRVCAANSTIVPAMGATAIAHNVTILDEQLAALLQAPFATRPARAAEVLREALDRRVAVADLVAWDGEVDDVRDVLSVLEGRARTRRAGFRLLRHA